mgnify:CR=1 FL=1
MEYPYIKNITHEKVQTLTSLVNAEDGQIVSKTLAQNDVFGTIEAVKTVSDAFLPVGGEVLEFNESLNDAPDRVNADPYGEGWIVKIRMSDPSELGVLLSADDYAKLIG